MNQEKIRTALKKEYLEKLKTDSELIAKIKDATNTSFQTVQRWANANHINLIREDVLAVMRKHYGLKIGVNMTEKIKVLKQVA